MISPAPAHAISVWLSYGYSADSSRKLEENTHRLHIANTLTRELQSMGIRVQRIDIAVPRPRLYLDITPSSALPLRGITRRRIDSDVVECAAILNDCELLWTEFEDEPLAA